MKNRDDEIVRLYKSGLAYREVGERLGLTGERVRQILVRLRVKTRPRTTTDLTRRGWKAGGVKLRIVFGKGVLLSALKMAGSIEGARRGFGTSSAPIDRLCREYGIEKAAYFRRELLSATDAKAIYRAMHDSGRTRATARELAGKYGVSLCTIRFIASGRLWSWATGAVLANHKDRRLRENRAPKRILSRPLDNR